MALQLNIKAPDFKAITDLSFEVSLSDFYGQWIVLYFYPKDNTSGCTKEACSFQENMGLIEKQNAVVLGVSPDSVKSHQNFKQKFSLNYTLLADTEKEICKLYDVLGEKSLYGKKYIGVIRTTYIINPQGKIVWVNPKVNVEGHVEEVLSILESFQEK